MKRPLLASVALLMTASLALPAAAQQNNQDDTPEGTLRYALQGDADAFRLGVGPGGLSLAFTRSDADSVPTASGLASAECQFDPEGNATCVEEATEESSYPGNGGDDQTTCAEPAPPAPLGKFLSLTEGCALSQSRLENDLPFTRNEATAGPIDINADFGAIPGAGQDIEDVKEGLIDQIKEVIGQGPENPIRDLVDQILIALEEDNIGEIELGPSSSDIDPDAGIITVTSTAKGPIVRLLGVPAVGEPLPGGEEPYDKCEITENAAGEPDTAWLYSIEVGEAKASALIDVAGRTVDVGETNAAAVTVTSPDLGSQEPTDCRTDPIAEDTEAVVIAEGTPLQSSIFVGGKRTEVGDDFAIAEAAGVSINLFENGDEPGAEGPPPIVIGAARTNASVAMAVDLPPTPRPPPTQPPPVQNNPPEEPRVLPDTGGDDYVPYAIVLLVAGVAIGVTARRLARR